ncbi:MAG: NAD(P)-dependent oxidoreductase [Devosiaceae bacterium]|nr:NAD(P)-dependent oxidoreductase [Devosiaceae bacterium]
MARGQSEKRILSNRLEPNDYIKGFCDLHSPLDQHEALVEAERCLFCYDAPCQTACPAEIDVALFIREITTNNTLGAAKTIFDQNIFGGMCARVCPVEILCEQACVRQTSEGKPVKIGQLQRFATDLAMNEDKQFYRSQSSTGKKIAIIGAGPAGISCAHRLSMLGHEVEIFDAKPKSGGLNEYGIAAYKSVNDFAQKEINYILKIGNIKIHHNKALGQDFTLKELENNYDAIFLGLGLGDVNNLNIKNESAKGVEDAIDFIAKLRQEHDKSKIPIGQDIVVIGGGMSAIDAAIQAKLLGAQNVTICYRRGKEQMGASEYEQQLATSKGVVIKHWLSPKKIKTKHGKLASVKFNYTELKNGKLMDINQSLTLKADQLFKAIGQNLISESISELQLKSKRILVDDNMQTSNKKIWAGGDCIFGGDDLTVTASANGRDAAIDINKKLLGGAK